jgi:hypothetical protein
MKKIWHAVILLVPFLTVIVLPLVIGELAGFAIAFWLWDGSLPLRGLSLFFFLTGFLLGTPLIPLAERVWRRYRVLEQQLLRSREFWLAAVRRPKDPDGPSR